MGIGLGINITMGIIQFTVGFASQSALKVKATIYMYKHIMPFV